MKKIRALFFDFKSDRYKVLTFFVLVFLIFFSIYSLTPQIAGDSLLYTDSIEVLKTGIHPVDFMPMMILTTYVGLKLIIFLDIFFKNISISWLVLDGILYVAMGLFFYSLVRRMFDSSKIAFISTLFLVTNYSAVVFGLGYLMDIGGWLAYIASIYFSYRYLMTYCKENKWLYFAALVIGIGGLYKEYAFAAYVVIFGIILWSDWGKWREIVVKVFITGLISFAPFALMNIYTFIYYDGYTYLDWFFYQEVYEYQNRPIEFIKSFGSIYNFGWFLFIPGLYLLLKRYKELFIDKNLFFILLVASSSFVVLLWPVVTRVLFISMPAVILITTLFIQRIEKKFYVILPILLVYIFCSFLMDAYILDFVNLPF